MLRLTRLPVALSCLVWALAPALTTTAQLEQRLRYGEAVEGTLSGSAAGQVWHFSGNAGDHVLIDMRPVGDSEMDTFLTLLDPQGNTLASDDDSGEGTSARLGVLTLRESRDYTILADRYDGAGAYLLWLIGSRIPLLMPGEATEITLGLGGGARYFFQAEEHTAIRLTALAVSALGSSVTLFSSDGPGTRALIATLEIPVTGLYQVDISDATEGAGTGTMTLRLELAND